MIYAMNGLSGSELNLLQEMLPVSIRDASLSFTVKQSGNLALASAADSDDSIYTVDRLSLICESSAISPEPALIAAAYKSHGRDFASKLEGRFSVCIYDAEKEVLFLARSRPASAPLYFCRDRNSFAFSSSQAALAVLKNLSPDSAAIMKFLAFDGANENPMSFFRDIKLIEPGETIEFNLKSGELSCFSLPEQILPENSDSETLRRIFEDAVRSSVKGIDNAGIFFSGGTDSRAALSVLSSEDLIRKPLSTFSVISEKRRIDETRLINEAVKLGGYRQFSLSIKPEEFFEDLPNLVRIQQSPVSNLSIYAQYKLMRLAALENMGTVIDCQGGDELFAGYPYFFSSFFYEKLKQFDLPGFIFENFAFFRRSMTFYPQILLILQAMPAHVKSLILRKLVKPWMNGELLLRHVGSASAGRWKLCDLSAARRQAVFMGRMPEIAAAAYANALSCKLRCVMPFMDKDMQDAALSVPSDALIHGGESRKIFREALSPLLPEPLRKRKDRLSMWLPENDFLRQAPCVSFMMDISSSESFKSREFWNWRIFEKELRRFCNGGSDRSQDIIRVISCELFLQSIHRKFR